MVIFLCRGQTGRLGWQSPIEGYAGTDPGMTEDSNVSPQRLALDKLAEARPGSVLLVASEPWKTEVAEALGKVNRTVLSPPLGPESLSGLGRFDAGLVTGVLSQLDPKAGVEFIGLLRNLHCTRVALTLEEGALLAGWTREALLALEFLPLAAAAKTGGTEVFLYDIDLYNRGRDWNTPESWANPQNFDKFRW